MAEPKTPSNNDGNPLVKVLGNRTSDEKSSAPVVDAINTQTTKFSTDFSGLISISTNNLNISKGIQNTLTDIRSALAGQGKEEAQESMRKQKDLFKMLSKSMSSQINSLSKTIKSIFPKGDGIMSIIKPVLLIGAAYLFRTYKALKSVFTIIESGVKSLPRLFRSLGGIGKFILEYLGKAFGSLKEGILPKVVSMFRSVFDGLKKTKIGKLFGQIAGKLKPVFDTIKTVVTKVKSVLDPVGKVFGNVFAKIKPVFSAIGGFFGKVGTFAKGTGGVLSKIGGVFSTVGRFVKPIFGVFKPLLGFVGKISKFFKAVPFLGQVITIIEGVVGFFRGFFGSKGSFFDKLIAGIQGIFAQIISGLTFGLLSFDDVMGFFDKVTDVLGNFFYSVYEFFSETVGPLLGKVWEGVKWYYTTMWEFFTETLPSVFVKVWEGVKWYFTSLWNFYTVTLPSFFSNAVSAVAGFFTELIPSFFTETLPSFFMNTLSAVGIFFTETIPTFFRETIPNMIISQFGMMGESVKFIFQTFLDLLMNPVENMKENITLLVTKMQLAILKVRMFIADKLSYIGLGEDTDELQKEIDAAENKQKEVLEKKLDRIKGKTAEESQTETQIEDKVKTEEEKRIERLNWESSIKMRQYERVLDRLGATEYASPKAVEIYMERNKTTQIGSDARGELRQIQEEIQREALLERERNAEERRQRIANQSGGPVVIQSSKSTQSFETGPVSSTETNPSSIRAITA